MIFNHVKAWQDHAADVVNIKISKFGGLTRAKEAVEFCTNVGLAMTIEDTWGGKLGAKYQQVKGISKFLRYDLKGLA